MKTLEEQREFARQAYGMELEDFEICVRGSVQHTDPAMLAMSMLSDAEEMIAMGAVEMGRQFINRAKYVIASHLMATRDPA